MRALAILFACLLATPSFAVGHGMTMHPGGFPHPAGFPHPGGFPHHGPFPHDGGHHFRRPGLLFDTGGTYFSPFEPAAPAVPEEASAPPTQILQLAPAAGCPSEQPAAAPSSLSGPHIIYIGHQPKITGPQVIYGIE